MLRIEARSGLSALDSKRSTLEGLDSRPTRGPQTVPGGLQTAVTNEDHRHTEPGGRRPVYAAYDVRDQFSVVGPNSFGGANYRLGTVSVRRCQTERFES